jgi:hypothetical protein
MPFLVTLGAARIRWGSAAAALVALSASLRAQTVGTISGSVVNESGYALEHAQVTLDPAGANRQVRTDRDGRFSLVGVSPGAHVVRASWVGYQPEERTIELTSGVVTVDFTLRRLTQLGAVIVTAKRTGLYGVVLARDSLRPVPGARIEVIGSRKADSTDAEGRFVMPDIRTGTYLVRVRHPQFESRNVPVVIPEGGSAELDIVVDRGLISRDQHMEMLYREMDSRLTFRGQHAEMVTRAELRGREGMPLDMAIQMVPRMAEKQFLIPWDACVFVDGIARAGAQVWDFLAGEIEAIEIYGAPYEKKQANADRALATADPTGSLRNRWPSRMQCGQEPVPGTRIPRSRVVAMYVLIWTRQR